MRHFLSCLCLLVAVTSSYAKEYHVSCQGNDTYDGSAAKPFRTINKAAQLALPWDTITVHAGVYREWVDPANGGRSADERILYRAAEGERVEIKGSELVKGWIRQKEGKSVWRIALPNTFFGTFNPFQENIYGDWLEDRSYHRGDVYLNDVSLYEAKTREAFHMDTLCSLRDPQGSSLLWFAEVDPDSTVIYARFGNADPNRERVEIAVRPTCFYPTRENVNYITVRGFHISQAATQWGSPSDEQIGMLGTHWNKGWIIEHNTIRNSRCIGISLGKERSSGHNVASHDGRLDGTSHYMEVIFNTLRKGWNRDNIGSHVVRYNTVSDCEQAGICGSMGAAFSEVYGNHIYNIHVKQQFFGYEIAGIKFHGAIDTHIHHNRIHDTGYRGIWMDWMSQGVRLSSNLLYRNAEADIFMEVCHGPIVVDNNFLLSPYSFRDHSDGIAYIHNLFAGYIKRFDDGRYVPYQLEHSTELKGIKNIVNGDHRFYNNIFLGQSSGEETFGLMPYSVSQWPIFAAGNLFGHYASPMRDSVRQGLSMEDFDLKVEVEEQPDGVYLVFNRDDFSDLQKVHTEVIDTEKLGRTYLSCYLFKNADDTDLTVDRDYWGNQRSAHPTVGPLEGMQGRKIKVWESHPE